MYGYLSIFSLGANDQNMLKGQARLKDIFYL